MIMGSQSEEMIRQHNEDELRELQAIDHAADVLTTKLRDSNQLATISKKSLINLAYWEGYKHGKAIK